MNLQLTDKVIIVAGGEKGMGEEIVKALAAEKAIPVIVSREETDNLKEFESAGNNGFQVVAELTDPVECENAIKKIVEKFGRIDGLVNNTDVIEGVDLEKGNYELFVGSLHQNLVDCYLITHFALPYLKQSKGPIVNTCFKREETGTVNIAAHATSSGGRDALTREWAVELLPYSIRVNAVVIAVPLCDAGIRAFEKTEENSKSKTGKISLKNEVAASGEIANIVMFLLSERSSHTTGELVPVVADWEWTINK